MSSILTNTSSMAALETLRNINRGLETVQAEISSGKRVSNSRDNAAVWAVAATMSGDVASFKSVSDALSIGSATVGVARSVTEKIVSTLEEIKTLIVQAQDESLDPAKYQDDIDAKRTLIDSYVKSAQFNGLNLLSGPVVAPATTPSAPGDIQVLASLNRNGNTVQASYIDVEAQDLRVGETTGLDFTDINVVNDAELALTTIEALLNTAIDAAAAFGSAQNAIEGQRDFIMTLVDSVSTGIGALTDTDMEAASARLQALQVQQQLGIQSLSIANQAPQGLLALFR